MSTPTTTPAEVQAVLSTYSEQHGSPEDFEQARAAVAAQPVALPDGWVAVPRRWTREMLDAFYRFCPHTDALYIHQAVSAAIAAAPAGEGVPK